MNFDLIRFDQRIKWDFSGSADFDDSANYLVCSGAKNSLQGEMCHSTMWTVDGAKYFV